MTGRRWCVMGPLLLLLVCAAAGAQEIGSPTGRPPLVVRGSGYTMPRVARAWADAFERRSGIPVRIEGTGTSTGPPALLRGEAHVAGMTRPMSPAELEAFRSRLGAEPLAIPVAADALAVFVNERNPLEALSLEQVDAIFGSTLRCGAAESIEQWGAVGLGGEWAGRRISLYGRRAGSGTGTYFANVALCGGSYKDWVRINPGGESAARAVAESRWAIGFGGRNDAIQGMKALALSRTTGAPALPERGAVYDGSYPLGRLLYFYVVQPEQRAWPEGLRAFLAFVLTEEAQEQAERAGFLHLTAETAARALQTLPR